MAFQWTSFGKVKYNGVIYEHDVWVDAKGEAHARDAEDHHVLTGAELKKYLKRSVIAVVFGNGQNGVARVADDAMRIIERRRLELHKYETPQAIKVYNEIAPTRKTIAVIHVTC
ncbi:MAG: MTH938/NDUFAF3 family protein [archaeon]